MGINVIVYISLKQSLFYGLLDMNEVALLNGLLSTS